MEIGDLEEKRMDHLFLEAKRKLTPALSICSFLKVIRERSTQTALERVKEVRDLLKEADKALEECITIVSGDQK